MPVLFEKMDSRFHLVVYKIDKTPEEYERGIDFTPFDILEYNRISNPLKRIQWLASRYWVKKISKQDYQLHLEKSELGKPHITNYPLKFSISHARNYIAVICSETSSVAIDIEPIQEKVLKIKHKFIHRNDFEQGTDQEKLTLIWSAKETIYKHYHTRDLYSFKEQIVVDTCSEGTLHYTLFNFQNQVKDVVYYTKIEDMFLTWIVDT